MEINRNLENTPYVRMIDLTYERNHLAEALCILLEIETDTDGNGIYTDEMTNIDSQLVKLNRKIYDLETQI